MAELPTTQELLGPRPEADLPTTEDILGQRPEADTPKTFGGELNDSFFSWDGNLVGRMMKTFGQDATHAWGATSTVGNDTIDYLKEKGVFNDWQKGQFDLVKGLNEAWMRPVINAGFGIAEPVLGALSGIAGAGEELGESLEGYASAADRSNIPGSDLAAAALGGTGEVIGAISSGQYIGGGGIPGMQTGIPTATAGRTAKALGRELPKSPVEPGMGSFGIPKRPERNFEGIPEPIIEGRAIGAIGESEGTFMGSVAPTEQESLGRAQATAATRDITVEPPTVDSVARSSFPDTFYDYDILRNKHDILSKSIVSARQEDPRVLAAQAKVDTILDKVKGIEESLTKAASERLSRARQELEDALESDSPEVKRLKELHAANYHEMEEISKDVRAAYREAGERLNGPKRQETFADLEEPYSEGVEKPAPEPSGSPVAAVTDTPAVAPAPINPIFLDASGRLQKAGRSKEESEAGARLIQAHYEARAARFKGKLGTAEELYAQESPEIVEGKEGPVRGKVLNQPDVLEQPRRGSITVRDGQKNIIKLFKNADASTFMHEIGHDWLEELRRDAAHPDAPQDLLDDWKAVNDWLGTKGSGKITRGQHEQFARGFERYLMEGTAPSEELAGIFQKFKDWLTEIYKSVTGLNVPVNDSIRGVFDRLLHTKHEPIITAEGPPKLLETEEAIPRGPEAPVTPTEVLPLHSTSYLQEDGQFKLENIQSYADLVAAIKQGSEEATDMALYAKQGKISNQDIIEIAESAGLNTTKINVNKLARLTVDDGIPLAARVWGLNNYLKQNAAKIRKLVSSENPDQEEVLAFIEAVSLHRKVSEVLLGIRGEWGRTGQILRKMLEEASTDGGLSDVMHSNIGATYSQVVQTMKLANGAVTNTKQVSQMVHALSERSWGQFLLQVLINGYISGPITHAVYSLGNKLTILNETMVRAPAYAAVGGIKKTLLGSTAERVTFGEVYDGMYGLVYGSRDALRALKAATKMGYQQGLLADDLVRARVLAEKKSGKLSVADEAAREADLNGKVQEFRDHFEVEDIAKDAERVARGKAPRIPQHLEEIFPIVAKSEPPQSHFTLNTAQRIRQRVGVKGIIEHAVNAPGERLVAPIHSIDYTLAYVIHQRRLISRTARMEGERSGWTQKQVAQRMAELENDTPLDIIKEARDSALDNTVLSKSGSWTGKLKGLLSHEFEVPFLGKTPWGSFMQPFVGIVTDVWKKGLEPFKYANPVTAMAFKNVRHDLAGKNGSLAQDQAIAKLSLGTVAFSAIWNYYDSGGGNGPPVHDVNESIINEMSDGIPYGIKIGDWSYDVERLGPIGLYMAIIADMVHAKNVARDDSFAAAAQDLVYSLGHLLSNTSAVSGVSDMFDALDEPSRYGQQYINGFLVSLATPYSVGVGQVNRLIDPNQREVSSGNAESENIPQMLYQEWKQLTKSWQSHIPGLSQRLPAKIDIFGQPVPNKEYWGVYAKEVSNDPVYQAFKNSKYFPGRVEKKILDYTLTEEEYEDYSRKIGVAAHIAWTRTVQIPGFQDFPEIRRHNMLQSDRRSAVNVARSMFLAQPEHQHIVIDAALTKAGIVDGLTPEQQVERDLKQGELGEGEIQKEEISKEPTEDYAYLNVKSEIKPETKSEPFPDLKTATELLSKSDYPEEDKWSQLMKTGKTTDITGITGNIDKVMEFVQKNLKDKTDSPVIARQIATSFVASRRNWISTLGFDPDKFAFDRGDTPKSIGGAYDEKKDVGFITNTRNPETLVHESIHRGLKVLSDNGDLSIDEKALIRGFNEDIVRYIVAKDMGDPQFGIGEIGQEQREAAIKAFEKETPQFKKILKSIEDKAAAAFYEKIKTTFPKIRGKK